jgi:hypothetical protein
MYIFNICIFLIHDSGAEPESIPPAIEALVQGAPSRFKHKARKQADGTVVDYVGFEVASEW